MNTRAVIALAIGVSIALAPRAVRTQAKPAPPAPPPTAEQFEALKKQVEALGAGQLAIQRQLQEIKALLQQGANPAAAAAPAAPGPVSTVNVVVDTQGSVSKGSATARITLIEFSDYQCPFCRAYARDTFASLDKEYVQTGKVRYVFRNYPLESIHPLAFKAGVAAECAAEQGKFWPMHDRLFANQNALAAAQLPGHAQALGLDMPMFTACLNSDRTGPRVRKDAEDAARAGSDSP